MGDEAEKIDDEQELIQVRRQARNVQIKAVVAAIVMTLVTLLLA